ncbi:sugar ABC transporter substrate-binding protein [Cohnella abietis]|uniref:Sugar ABC transporter substrate-binding protein n=2 Tax=Cohnella abietis TaxID=2507935 RepID=A0A3T1D667_9BACL|nr:sugar ABC transporter substrate-binding protein [Cohnella abietis]
MIQTKKWLVLGVSMTLVAGLLAGCGGKSTPNASEGTETASNANQPHKGKKLTVYLGNLPLGNTLKTMIPEFEKETGMKVEFQSFAEDQLSQKLSIQLTTQASVPDVFMLRPPQEAKLFAKNGWVYPLDELARQDADYDFGDFSESATQANVVDDKLIGIPVLLDQTVVYYRKDLLEKAGIAVPKTLDELEEAIKTLHDPKKEVYGFVARGQRSALVTMVAPFLFSEGADFMQGDKATVNTPEAIKGFGRYANWLKNYGPPGVLNMAFPQAWGIFAQGKAAFFIEFSSSYTNGTDKEKSVVADDIGYAVFPTGAAGSKPVSASTWALSINANAADKDAAWQFIKWATSKKMVGTLQKEGNPGVRDSVWNDPESTSAFPAELVEVTLENSKIGIGHDRPQVISVGEAREIIGDIVVKAMLGEDIQAAADKANKDFQALIDKEKLK